MDANTIVDLALELLDPADPMRSARRMVEVLFTDPDGHRLLHHHRGDFRQFPIKPLCICHDRNHSLGGVEFSRKIKAAREEGPARSLQAEHRAGFQCNRCPCRGLPLGQRH